MYNIELHRISLGALIIALGMLVDNAIVVTEGILIGIQRGKSKIEAASAIVKQTMWPLLGATAIAITAFAPIGLSDDSTGEFAGTLFWVLFISLLISWFTAISLTPFIADLFFKDGQSDSATSDNQDPYQGAIFIGYKWLLNLSMKHRWLTTLLMVALLGSSIYGFSNIKQSFFPFSNTPIYLIDYWLPQGTDIRKTKADLSAIEEFVLSHPEVEQVSSTTGQGAQRFMLTYSPEKQYANYAQLIVRVNAYKDLLPMVEKTKAFIAENYPDAQTKSKFLEIGPSSDAKIEARFTGPDPEVLRNLAEQTKVIFRNDPGTRNIRDNWQERTKLLQPQFNESLARRAGISRKDLDDLLQMTFSGQQIGLYRDGADLLPIISRPPADERVDVDNINSLQIWSPTLKQYIPIQQVAPEYAVIWEDPIIMRRDRKRELTVMADNDIMSDETAAQVFKRVRTQVEALELPSGYALNWGGEYESSTDAQNALGKSMPMGYLVMFLITVFLFNSVRQPLVIWSCVPLAVIGVTIGLLVMNESFGFMALLGMLSLSGMLLKNGIVLLDQINEEINSGSEVFEAVFNSAVSRVRPVGLAALTTILGMVPLLGDPFFVSMAVTIMFGLGFATVLTLLVVPVFYVLFHGVKYRQLN
jgi:multidrug efflux pump subunit AcrB